MKLHEAIDAVLAERPGRSYRELAEGSQDRYVKRDGLSADAGQVNARVKARDYRDRYVVDDNGLVWPA